MSERNCNRACRNSLILFGDVTSVGMEYFVNQMGVATFKFNLQYDGLNFIKVDVYGKAAEECHEFCKPAVTVRVYGRLKQERFPDKNSTNGRPNEVHFTHVIAKKVEFVREAPDFKGESEESKQKGRDIHDAFLADYYYEIGELKLPETLPKSLQKALLKK